jgi:hypothetical protein
LASTAISWSRRSPATGRQSAASPQGGRLACDEAQLTGWCRVQVAPATSTGRAGSTCPTSTPRRCLPAGRKPSARRGRSTHRRRQGSVSSDDLGCPVRRFLGLDWGLGDRSERRRRALRVGVAGGGLFGGHGGNVLLGLGLAVEGPGSLLAIVVNPPRQPALTLRVACGSEQTGGGTMLLVGAPCAGTGLVGSG